jgi:hypothetical protein
MYCSLKYTFTRRKLNAFFVDHNRKERYALPPNNHEIQSSQEEASLVNTQNLGTPS